MPPKKKKPAVNPIVVGTVSTRSTRRQSIVNIEIPKLSRSKASAKEVGKLLTMSTKNNYSGSTSHASSDLTEKIKESYNKMIKRVIVDTKTDNSTSTPNALNTTFYMNSVTNKGLSKFANPKLGPPKTYKASLVKSYTLSTEKSKFKSNKALLQILEDWTDDDSQDGKRDNSEVESSDSENVKYSDQLNVKEETPDNYSSNENNEDVEFINCGINNESLTEETSDIDGIQREIKSETDSHENEAHTFEVNRETHMEMEGDSEICHVTQTDNFDGSETEEIIEIVVEDDTVVIEDHIEETVAFDENDYMVECVTEEIVSEDNEVMDTAEDSSALFSAKNDQEQVVNETMIKEPEEKNKVSKPVDIVEISETSEDVRENLILEETSQSISTTDSNDAEVRSYFSKEIENNEIVKEEDIPNITCQSKDRDSSNKDNSDVDNIVEISEESTPQSEDTPEAIETEQQEETLKTQENKRIMGNVELEEILNKSDASFDETLYSKQNFRQEEILEIIGQGVESKMFRKSNFGETMDATEDASEESLESKVAELHLKDDSKKDEEVLNNRQNELDESEQIKEKPVEKDTEKEGDIVKEDIKMDVDKVEESTEELKVMLEELPIKRPKTRRTRSVDSKSSDKVDRESHVTKLQKSTKPSKSSKDQNTSKAKDIKAKESRRDSKSKKKLSTPPTAKKSKDKIFKGDKKEPSRKTSKADYDHSKKSSRSDNTDSEDTEVRRSSRIKSISVLKKKTTGHGLVRSKSEPILNESDVSDSNSTQTESEKSTPSTSPKVVRERKTRWTRSSDNLTDSQASVVDSIMSKCDNQLPQVTSLVVDEKPKLLLRDPVVEARLKQFIHLKENMYKTDRMTCKEAKKMTCDCFLTSEEIEAKEYGCGEDCLNRLLLIECGSLCQIGDRCTNKRFQKAQFAPVEVFNTDKKGLGLRAAANIPYGEFILEYVGEVLNCDEFDKRAEVYSQDKNIHYYFMSLRADAIIDATMKGNISRFINHSCDPNAETQKWTVNGELRIGFFSTRTILAGEEITFDYRFQRYGKEAQKCYCEASICRGWLGDQPDEDSEDEDEEEEEEEEEEGEAMAAVKIEIPAKVSVELEKFDEERKPALVSEAAKDIGVKTEKEIEKTGRVSATIKRKSPRKKARKDIFEDLDQLDEEIEMLVTTGLKNQAHTLKLSRLMVRAKEPAQRTKLLRILRRGELPCRRLFLDYHGLRLIHGYMIDAQHLVHTDKKYESVRLEMLQTLAVLPIPNKTMLQDSKVLPTVENWASNKDLGSPLDSDSNSPKTEQEPTPPDHSAKEKNKDGTVKLEEAKKEGPKPERSIEDQEEEIRFLAMKLLEEWANLKEVFRIPKKERIEQMKEHEREANKKFMQGGYGGEQDSNRKNDRQRGHLSRYKLERESCRKGGAKLGEKPSAEFIRLSKIERRKLFALQHELKEEERRLKQREMWRQHELNCMMIGTDPRFTAPFDPSRGYQCIWNPQIGQWQNYPLPPQDQSLFPSQPPTPISTPMATPISNISLPPLPNLSVPPPQIPLPKSIPSYSYPAQMGIPTSLNGGISQLPTSIGLTGQVQASAPTGMHMQQQMPNLPANVPQMTSMQAIAGSLPQVIPTHSQVQISTSLPISQVQYQEPLKNEDDPSLVKFMGPIPPPAKLPPKWKCAKDKYGRPYYYHIQIRRSQWEPPPFVEPEEPEDSTESDSSSDTSSVSSDTSSENSDSDDDIDDTRLLMEVRKQMEKSTKLTLTTVIPEHVKTEETSTSTPSPDDRMSDEDMDLDDDIPMNSSFMDDDIERPSIDIRLKEQFDLLKDDKPPRKKRRLGLCEEILISPRTEEDKQQFKEDVKRYKANKEKLKRQKEVIMQQTKKQMREMEVKKVKDKRLKATLKSRIKEMPDFNSEAAKKIKESFRSNMASTVVGSLNAYRKPDCKEGKITNTEDFKHLARKLTHFVMLKEMKHIARIEDLTCTDNVKSKAREYIRKYMSKFGEVYIKRNDSPDFKD